MNIEDKNIFGNIVKILVDHEINFIDVWIKDEYNKGYGKADHNQISLWNNRRQELLEILSSIRRKQNVQEKHKGTFESSKKTL